MKQQLWVEDFVDKHMFASCVWYFDRSYNGFYMAPCRIHISYMNEENKSWSYTELNKLTKIQHVFFLIPQISLCDSDNFEGHSKYRAYIPEVTSPENRTRYTYVHPCCKSKKSSDEYSSGNNFARMLYTYQDPLHVIQSDHDAGTALLPLH